MGKTFNSFPFHFSSTSSISNWICLRVRREKWFIGVSNILQVICQQIFSDSDANDHHGLLRHPPFDVRNGLEEILHECISIQNVDDNDENTALHEMKIIYQIRNILLKSLSKHTVWSKINYKLKRLDVTCSIFSC